MLLEFSIVTISAFVAMLNELTKDIASVYFKYDISKYVPLFSLGFGLILGIIGFFLPEVEMGNNIVEAIFIGLAAGASATGVHQVGKQLSKPSCYVPLDNQNESNDEQTTDETDDVESDEN